MLRVRPFGARLMAGGLLFLFAAGGSFAQDVSGPARSFLDEAGRYPDMTQTDVRAGLPWGGWLHCGPVAVSNGLVWLRERGIEIGPPSSGDPWTDQVEMVRSLGSRRYMDTAFSSHGTTVADFLDGLEGYLRDHSPEGFSIRYMGWAEHRERFSTGLMAPDLYRVCSALAAGSAVFLDLGWYRSGKDPGVYSRNGGHWVTLVGYDWPAEQVYPVLYVHDPAPWSGKSRRTHRVRLAHAGNGLFTDRSGTGIGSLESYPRIVEGLSFKGGTEMALLEGAVILSPEVPPAVPWTGKVRGRKVPVLFRQPVGGGDGR